MAVTGYNFDPPRAESFFDFTTALYHDDPHWIAPLRSTLRSQFDPTFSFYNKPGNHHRHFLATANGKAVGHVSAFVNADLRDEVGDPVGAIGFFECVNDRGVADDLLATATDWLRSHGRPRIWGPMNFDIWHGYRLQSRGFDESPFYGEPHTKPYYVELFDRFGFKPRQHWHSIMIAGKAAIDSLAAHRAGYLDALLDQGYRFEAFDTRSGAEQAEKIHAVMTESFARFMGYTPLPASEFAPMFETYVRVMDPRLVTLIYDDVGDLAGFSVAYPDLAEAVRAMRGSDDIRAKLRFLWRRRRARRAVYHMVGITPREARKRRGTGRAIFCHTTRQILAAGYDTMIAALIAEGNSSRGLLDDYAKQKNRQYTLYEIKP